MPTISEFSYGGSASGVEELLSSLQSLIATAVATVNDLSTVNNALDANWAGAAQEKFKIDLADTASTVADAIEVIFGGLDTEISSAMSAMQENDMHMFG